MLLNRTYATAQDSQLILVGDEKYCVEASDLGLRPGECPVQVLVTSAAGVRFFDRVSTSTDIWNYRSRDKQATLTIFND
jgi:hypothetical protein